MANTAPVIDRDGLRGTVDMDLLVNQDSEQVLVRLEDGKAILLRREMLLSQDNGSYYVPISLASVGIQDAAGMVLPIINEEFELYKREVESGRVRVSKRVTEREVVVDQPLMQEQVEVSRVEVNRIVEEAPTVRYEGDTIIIPLLEEVLVVEKRLMLKEEVHLTRRKTEIHNPQRVTLRSEEVNVERLSDQQNTNLGATTDIP